MDSLLNGLLPPTIRTAASLIEDHVDALLPAERSLVQTAIASRQNEFATGRFLARRLLGELGHPDFPILREEDRIPCWPEDVVGSITHSGNICLVAVGLAREFRGIGIDVEPDEPVGRDIERVVLRDHEHDWVAEGQGAERGRRCRFVFSVKEAVYKAFYPRTRQFWSFQDVTVAIDLAADRFEARLPESAGLERIDGRVGLRAGWIVAAVAVRG